MVWSSPNSKILISEKEAAEQAGAGKYKKNGSIRIYRNVTRFQYLKSRYGSLNLNKPLLRIVPFGTQVFERHSKIENALENAIIESYLQGVSTRKIEYVIYYPGIEKISASYVSSIVKEFDSKVIEFLSRPVESYIPYLFVDVSYFKIRDGIKYSNKA